MIWESVRASNYADRAWDGALSVITILWQVVHTLIRAFWSEHINRGREESDGGKIFVNWLFTDQGNFSINLLIRLIQSFPDGGGSNWALSFARRVLKYFTNVTNVRSIYYFTRSAWYFRDRAENRQESDSNEVSLVRMLWAVWGPMMWFAAFFSIFLSWDHFDLERFNEARTLSILIVGSVIGLLLGYCVLNVLTDENPFTLSVSSDWWTTILFYVLWILALIAFIIIIDDLESGKSGVAIGIFAAIASLLLIPMIGLPFVFGEDNAWEYVFLDLFVIFSSLFTAGLLPMFLWWFYVDDGRDKHDVFDGKNPESSPYKLPYRADENWLCGQGVHGIFSHTPTDVRTTANLDNHYAYDFNERENKDVLASRDGIVLDIIKDNANGSDWQNSIDVLHLNWREGHDPGSNEERVLTYSTYVHLSQNRVWIDIGHRFVQGYHIANIDSTGTSAQHHLHFHAEEFQRRVERPTTPPADPAHGRRNMTIPVVFEDSSTHRFRHVPFIHLAWPGNHHIPGKPLSMAFYTSENDEQDPLINPLVISLDEQGTPLHEHWIIIDKTIIENGPLPASLTLRTTVNERHFHEIILTRDQLANIVRMRDLVDLNVSTVDGHHHALVGYKYQDPTVFIRLTDAENPNHGHWLHIEQGGWEWGGIPQTPPLFTFTSEDFTDSAGNSHDHTIDLDRQQLFDILRRRRLPASLNVNPTNGHTHRLREVARPGPNQPEMNIVEPPRGQLLAQNPGPYQLVGDQLVVRVNKKAIEYFFYGVHRPRLLGEISLDRGLNTLNLEVDGQPYTVNTSDNSVRGTVFALNREFRNPAPTSPSIPVEVRAEPVIVIETIQRGSDASLQVDAGSSDAFVTNGEANGSGALGSVNQATPNQLANHFNTIINAGWSDPPITSQNPPRTIETQVVGNQLELTFGGASITFPDQHTRNSEILSRLYDSSNSRLRATGPIPFSSGRMHFTSTYSIPVLGTSAQVQIDTALPIFTGSDLTATPLVVEVGGRTDSITLETGDSTPAILARKIALRVEGVRAWESRTNEVTVQTLGVGPTIELQIRKGVSGNPNFFQQTDRGDAPNLQDSYALEPTELHNIIQDAITRATLTYDATALAPQALIESNQLVLRVSASHTISVTAVRLSGGNDPFEFTQNGDTEVRSRILDSNIDLNGPGWVELDIDGNVVIVPLDGEPARIELIPTDRLPENGENLTLAINGGSSSSFSFTGDEANVSAIADAVAQHFSDISVRIAYRLSFENTMYNQPAHMLELSDASGLALAGFLEDRATYTTTAVSAATVDHLAVPELLTAPQRDNGLPVNAFTVHETASGELITWELAVQAGFTVAFTTIPGDDPLNITGGGTNRLTTAAIPTELTLTHQCYRYDFEIMNSSGATEMASRLQIAGSPAMIRANDSFSTSLPSNTTLPITVVEPISTDATVERIFSVNLAGINSLDETVHRLNAEVPAIRAWVARPAGNERLHIETRGYGTGWALRLGNPLLLLALGFDESQIDLNESQIEVSGGGDVRNGSKVTQDEIRRAIQRVERCVTLLVRSPLQIERSGSSDLVLRSLEGPVTIETEPSSIKQALNVNESGGIATISPGANTVALDSGLVIAKAGGRSVAAIRLFGDHATVSATEPLPAAGSADATRQLTQLKAHQIIVRATGTNLAVGPLDASINTLEDAVEWYAANVPTEVWIGIDGSSQVVLQTRRRGDASLSIEIDFSNFAGETFNPGESLLGFVVAPTSGGNVWQFNGLGFGNVLDMDAVPVWSTTPDSLEHFLTSSAQRGASRQAVYDVEVDTTSTPVDLQINSKLSTQRLRHPAPPAANPVPGSIQFTVPGGGTWGRTIEATYSLTTPVRPGELSLEFREGTVNRSVIALIAGTPARLIQLTFPSSLGVLNNSGFTLALGNASGSTPFNVQFSGITNERQAAAQVERQCAWRVRANVKSGTLIIETVDSGTAATLSLSAPSGSIANAVTNDNATGFLAGSAASPASLPLNERGEAQCQRCTI
ncbi:M23 family metallopeptidase [Chloroflexi bacterium TSY]|nr:M23 family metallopeptidase [Chloroflexi bacterium TSY]